MLNLDQGGLAYALAVVRECYEKCSLLLACDASDADLALNPRAVGVTFTEHRQQQR